ncbi:GTP-binding protein Rhes [Puntigrus tetrazona]|uniref:GTP-binding protein Rhes n=1 Tax=Puntigrus tetrazona TaxID=1606681 RepID=UPI001C8A9F49|nr:GTP-binding protein Rhes [Puntigrus tetrazona]
MAHITAHRSGKRLVPLGTWAALLSITATTRARVHKQRAASAPQYFSRAHPIDTKQIRLPSMRPVMEQSVKAAAALQPGVLLAYRSATGFGVSALSKAGLGILKLATTQLKQQEQKARVARASSLDKRSPLDQLAALVLHGNARLQPLAGEPHATKPQNCRRIVVLGAPRVGKTSILRRFLRDGFEERYEPTSEDFHRKLYRIRGETYQIDILDASGERSFPAKRRLSILTGDIFLLVFSVDDRGSFEEARALHAEILAAKTALHRSKQKARAPTVVCANKVDLPSERRAVSRTEVLRALGPGCALFETSAKDCVNLEQVFEALARRGGLPLETGPSQHRKVSIRSYQALRAAACDAPCGALFPLARRPSFGTDLRLVLGPKAGRKQSKAPDRCQIQ